MDIIFCKLHSADSSGQMNFKLKRIKIFCLTEFCRSCFVHCLEGVSKGLLALISAQQSNFHNRFFGKYQKLCRFREPPSSGICVDRQAGCLCKNPVQMVFGIVQCGCYRFQIQLIMQMIFHITDSLRNNMYCLIVHEFPSIYYMYFSSITGCCCSL